VEGGAPSRAASSVDAAAAAARRRRPSPASSAPAGRPAPSPYCVLIAPRCTRSREPRPSREGPERGQGGGWEEGRMINAHITRTAAARTHAHGAARLRRGEHRTQRVNSELCTAWRALFTMKPSWTRKRATTVPSGYSTPLHSTRSVAGCELSEQKITPAIPANER